jgi:hypothetical protein
MKTKESGKKLSSFTKNNKNPFMEQAIEEIKGHVVKKYRSATNTGEKAILKAVDDNGELLGHTSFVRNIEVDEAQFTKIYLSNFSAFHDLGKQAIRIFGYIMTKLVPKQDLFIFLLDEALDYTEYVTKGPVYKGLGELVEAGIIARGPSDTLYYINPMVVFNGDRITFAKTYVKKQKAKIVNPNQRSLDFPTQG